MDGVEEMSDKKGKFFLLECFVTQGGQRKKKINGKEVAEEIERSIFAGHGQCPSWIAE